MHTSNYNKIPISDLLSSKLGTTVELTTSIPDLNDSEITVQPDQTIKFTALRLEDGICLYPQEQEINIDFACTTCLKKSSLSLKLRHLEKQYYLKIPEDIDPDLVELIESKHYEINIEPFIREIIFLSLPVILKCDSNCSLQHTPPLDDSKTYNPFQDLKKMI